MKNRNADASIPKFPVSRPAVGQFQFSPEQLFPDYTLFFKEYRDFRFTAYKINQGRKKARSADAAAARLPYAKPSDLNAAALINLIFFHLFQRFQSRIAPDLPQRLLTLFQTSLTPEQQGTLLPQITDLFPFEGNLADPAVFSDFIIRSVVIRLDNENPALNEYQDLFSDALLQQNPDFRLFFRSIHTLFSGLPSLSPGTASFLDFLREPFRRFPNSLYDQLAFIQKEWAPFIGDLLALIVSALDFLKEEYKPVFTGFGDQAQAPDYGLLNDEYEAFTVDKNWMPNVVMLAKSTLVWLDQLSKKYRYRIERLDQIPDKELDLIRSMGFNAVWLIGIWERSKASKTIKHIYGNYDAEASAYSLFDYDISMQLGGWEALETLKKRCAQRGIRLASDMVPNHTGLDSKWMIEHPERFLQLPYNPMPHYTFNGTNLSDRGDIGIYLEDKYYSKTDCAVVFKRVQFQTGETRYIYHGNDGTGLPWNDTAQLDYLNPEVREAVIQTILHVARNFSIIRFDAAMTLTKRHIQRLWYPAPGQGGDIPTRSEHAMSTAAFNAAMPNEFWREVVDRIAAEVPDTLLLAEAFWMLEGFFVRTLGMHRVYNSAFMHMLRDEKNAQYRHLIKETLEFDPEILKRYVNFMNNPDEESAAEQFGKDDKYFGICVMLCTLPGLPMFGHGQIEGFYEKYGMEFHKALWNEVPDDYLINRHKREIFPLLHQRSLFSEVAHFTFYDFTAFDGYVNESVFAFSNYTDTENALVVYNNRYERTSGNLFRGVPVKDKSTGQLLHPTVLDFIRAVTDDLQDDDFILFTETKTHLDYIRPLGEIRGKGITCLLSGYEYQIFQNFRNVHDTDGNYEKLYRHLNGAGTFDLPFEAAIFPRKAYFKAAYHVLSPNLLNIVYDFCEGPVQVNLKSFLHESFNKYKADFFKIENSSKRKKKIFSILELAESSLFNTCTHLSNLYLEKNRCSNSFYSLVAREQTLFPNAIPFLIAWTIVQVFKSFDPDYYYEFSMANFIKFISKRYFKDYKTIERIKVLTDLTQIIDENGNSFDSLFQNPEIIQFAHINDYQSVTWFDKEPMETLLILRLYNQFVKLNISSETPVSIDAPLNDCFNDFLHAVAMLNKSDYRLQRFLEFVKK